MKFQSLLVDIVTSLNKNSVCFTSTKLIKLAYLVELEYYRCYRDRATDVNWIYYKYGPYVMDYERYLDGPLRRIKDDDAQYHKIVLDDCGDCIPSDRQTKRIIERVVNEFGHYQLTDLLDHVYFNTEPMMAVQHRYEALDFKTVLTKSDTRIKEIDIDPKVYDEILNRFKSRISNECC